MAITEIEYALLTQLRDSGLLPAKPHVLEFGESNWYNDVPIDKLYADIQTSGREDTAELTAKLTAILENQGSSHLFEIAKIFWRVFLDYESITAIDLHGINAHQFDLNYPVFMEQQFDITINLGTAEHIFNIGQFFATVHELTAPGGLMIHGLPFTGWIDHGFYNFQPTFIWDLAAHTEYDLLYFIYTELQPLKLVNLHSRDDIIAMAKSAQLGNNALLHAVLRKKHESEFQPLMQGYYNDTISNTAKAAWCELR